MGALQHCNSTNHATFLLKPECHKGFYGEGCKKICSEQCGGDLNSCHHVNGSCNYGCDPGYTGSLCIQGETYAVVGKKQYFIESVLLLELTIVAGNLFKKTE